MPHIHLPEGLPGIVSGFAFRPETARPMRELAEILLRGPSSLTSGEREMIATLVSTRNDCYFCQTSHRAAAAHHLDGNYELVDAVRFNHQHAPVSAKLKGFLRSRGRFSKTAKLCSPRTSRERGRKALRISKFTTPFSLPRPSACITGMWMGFHVHSPGSTTVRPNGCSNGA